MKRIVIITYIPFWRDGAGYCTRLLALIQYLSGNYNLTVLFGGLCEDKDEELLQLLTHNFEVKFLSKTKMLRLEEYSSIIQEYSKINHFDICILEYVELSFLLKALPKRVKVILDTHDLIFERHKSFAKYGVESFSKALSLFSYTEEEELDQFKSYDGVIIINKADLETVKKTLDPNKIIVAPHPPMLCRRKIRLLVRNIGFIASGYYPNVDAIKFFIEHVWTSLIPFKVNLHIFGSIDRKLPFDLEDLRGKNIFVHGFVPDINEVYRNIDIVINPVRFGAGMKIKNLEALGNALPLVTTSHGARGLEDEVNKSFFVADTAEQFRIVMCELIANSQKRKLVSNKAFEFISQNFTPHSCFGELKKFIDDLT